jgi:hypothetical protein
MALYSAPLPPFVRTSSWIEAAGTDVVISWAWFNHRIGDLLFAAITSKRGTIAVVANGNETGWTELGSIDVDASTSASADHRTSLWVCRATSTAMPAATFRNTSSDYMLGLVASVRGGSERGLLTAGLAGGAINAVLTESNTNGLNTYTWGAVTTTVADCLILYFCGTGESTSTVSSFANATLQDAAEQQEAGTALGDDGSIYLGIGYKATAGSTGTATATPSLGSRAQSRFTVAVAPPQIDAAAPVVTPTPASGATVDDDDSLQIDVTDAYGDGLADVSIVALHGDGTADNVYTNGAFGTKYSNVTNATSSITNGTRYVVKRDTPGLPASSVTYRVIATDKQGNRTVSDLAYTVTGFFVASSPAVAAYSPAPGAIGAAASVTIDVTDADADLHRMIVSVVRGDGTTELVHDGLTSGFLAPYAASSTNTAISNGRRLVVTRTGGWGVAAFTLNVRAIDAGARETTRTGDFTTDFAEAAPVVVAVTAEGAIEAADPIEFDVTDVDGDLETVIVTATYGADFAAGVLTETVYEEGAFAAAFLAGSTDGAIANGLGFSLERDAGWPSADVLVRVTAIDAEGRTTVEEFVYETDFEADPGDVAAPTITLISPLDGNLGANTPIVVDVEDDLELAIAAVQARFPNGRLEVVHDGAGKGPHYSATPNAREVLDAGLRHRFTILRDGGWSSRIGAPKIEFLVRDAAGNVAVIA